ncbi:hypothetical protein [Streptomyces sp. NPDC006463]|uniref:hypothetical protein n=1 Tax=Streptomyces sp. NPDC006463 TaxID=3364746 RepID=UPI0036AC1810
MSWPRCSTKSVGVVAVVGVVGVVGVEEQRAARRLVRALAWMVVVGLAHHAADLAHQGGGPHVVAVMSPTVTDSAPPP